MITVVRVTVIYTFSFQEPLELAHARLRGSKADLVSIRSESLKATKRRYGSYRFELT